MASFVCKILLVYYLRVRSFSSSSSSLWWPRPGQTQIWIFVVYSGYDATHSSDFTAQHLHNLVGQFRYCLWAVSYQKHHFLNVKSAQRLVTMLLIWSHTFAFAAAKTVLQVSNLSCSDDPQSSRSTLELIHLLFSLHPHRNQCRCAFQPFHWQVPLTA